MPFKFSPGHCGPDCMCDEGPVCVPNPDDPGGIYILPCDPCNIPCRDLTLNWTNVLTGSGSTLLVHVSDNLWVSDCVNQIVFSLSCAGGSLLFTATAYASGTCPTGTVAAVCSSADGSLSVATNCDSGAFTLTYTPQSSGCSYLVTRGYTRFQVTQ